MNGRRRRGIGRVGALLGGLAIAAGCSSAPDLPPLADQPAQLPSATAAAVGSGTHAHAAAHAGRLVHSSAVATLAPSTAPSFVMPNQTSEPIVCPPLADPGPAGSDLTFSGDCAFTEQRLLPCPNNPQNPDDFYLRFERAMKHGLIIYVDINVEHYKHPGTYQNLATIIIEIPDGQTIYEWSTNTGTVTIDPGGTSGSLPQNVLPADIGTPTKGSESLQGSFRCG
jgi:hypothetical protein